MFFDKDVLETIERLKEDARKTAENGDNQPPENSGGYKKDIDSMFIQGVYKDAQGKKRPCYNMTRDGFSLLIMGFTGAKALDVV